MEERPTFHEIKALAAYFFDSQGDGPPARMALTDSKSTKILEIIFSGSSYLKQTLSKTQKDKIFK